MRSRSAVVSSLHYVASALSILLCLVAKHGTTTGFQVKLPSLAPPSLLVPNDIDSRRYLLPVDSSALDSFTTTVVSNPSEWLGISSFFTMAKNILPTDLYMDALVSHPLITKMMTGATLALTGDFVAQTRVPVATTTTNDDDNRNVVAYDKRRAVSFAMFDSVYRATQHVLYPLVVQNCRGQFIVSLSSSMVLLSIGNNEAVTTTATTITPDIAAAIEQTLVSQLVIVPLFYYPVFYAVTSYVQGLNWNETVERAQETFLPLMKRNLLFWIPVQFVQFSWIPEDLQIPFLSVCGLCWTMILSVMAGSAKSYHAPTTAAATNDDDDDDATSVNTISDSTNGSTDNDTTTTDIYCVTGFEDGCHIDENELFPETTMEDVTHELEDIAEHMTSEFQHVLEDLTVGNSNKDHDCHEEQDSVVVRKDKVSTRK